MTTSLRDRILAGGLVPRWFISVAGPLLIIAALPLAAIVFGIAIGLIGASVVAKSFAAGTPCSATTATAPPVIDATYTVVEDRKTQV
jgi:hypothetical protein